MKIKPLPFHCHHHDHQHYWRHFLRVGSTPSRRKCPPSFVRLFVCSAWMSLCICICFGCSASVSVACLCLHALNHSFVSFSWCFSVSLPPSGGCMLLSYLCMSLLVCVSLCQFVLVRVQPPNRAPLCVCVFLFPPLCMCHGRQCSLFDLFPYSFVVCGRSMYVPFLVSLCARVVVGTCLRVN